MIANRPYPPIKPCNPNGSHSSACQITRHAGHPPSWPAGRIGRILHTKTGSQPHNATCVSRADPANGPVVGAGQPCSAGPVEPAGTGAEPERGCGGGGPGDGGRGGGEDGGLDLSGAGPAEGGGRGGEGAAGGGEVVDQQDPPAGEAEARRRGRPGRRAGAGHPAGAAPGAAARRGGQGDQG